MSEKDNESPDWREDYWAVLTAEMSATRNTNERMYLHVCVRTSKGTERAQGMSEIDNETTDSRGKRREREKKKTNLF